MLSKLLWSSVLLLLLGVTFCPVAVFAQSTTEARLRGFHDDLLDNLVGEWKLVRKIQGRITENVAKGDWVLNHQFLRLHMRHIDNPPAYEATLFIGYDTVENRYVVHWIDVFGGRSSQTLGYGTRSGDSLKFLFSYPEHPFINTFTWNSQTKTWNFLMQQKKQDKTWTIFAEDNLSRISPVK